MLNKAYAVGQDVVHDVRHTTHELVHAVEQPIANIYTEAKTVIGGTYNIGRMAIHLASYYFVGWLGWSAFGEFFPSEKRSIENSVSRAFKRPRY